MPALPIAVPGGMWAAVAITLVFVLVIVLVAVVTGADDTEIRVFGCSVRLQWKGRGARRRGGRRTR